MDDRLSPSPAGPGATPVLVVDLDGTLIRSDMLYESFWAACRQDWRAPAAALGALRRGRAGLKRSLAARAGVEPASLPFNPAVIERIGRWREAGGRVALVTASDQGIAERIAGHLGLFDEVHGSDGETNLKGPRKAAFLDARFGPGGYAYMGDSRADLPVWRGAAQAITVGAAPRLRQAVEGLGVASEHLAPPGPAWRGVLRAMRPHQWLKNLLVFLPMIVGHRIDAATFGLSLIAFVAFSLIASSVYLLNDLLDLAADRAHPRKRRRPLASGELPISRGTVMAPLLLIAGLVPSLFLGAGFLGVVLLYYLLTLAYSFRLKRLIVIDICTLAGLYTVRILAGGAATGIEPSVWLLAFSMFFFLALAAVKRQAELVDSAQRGELKASGRGYHVEDVTIVSQMGVAAGYVSVLVMALYVNSPSVTRLYHYPEALWGICLVLLYWVSRIAMITHRGQMHDDPVVFAARDRASWFCGALVLGLGAVAALA